MFIWAVSPVAAIDILLLIGVFRGFGVNETQGVENAAEKIVRRGDSPAFQ